MRGRRVLRVPPNGGLGPGHDRGPRQRRRNSAFAAAAAAAATVAGVPGYSRSGRLQPQWSRCGLHEPLTPAAVAANGHLGCILDPRTAQPCATPAGCADSTPSHGRHFTSPGCTMDCEEPGCAQREKYIGPDFPERTRPLGVRILRAPYLCCGAMHLGARQAGMRARKLSPWSHPRAADYVYTPVADLAPGTRCVAGH